MADILKISTPLVDKAPIQPTKPADPSVPFNLSDVTKVVGPGQGSEILKQNSGMIQREGAPTILMDLLKDPSVTVGFLKNIFMLQEIINLLPANNVTLTQEIQQLFQQLLVKPDEIVAELTRQELSSTNFKGDLFTFLRGIVMQNPKPELRYGIANLLKALNGRFGRQDILRSVSNSLLFLSDSLQTSKGLSNRILGLSQQFAAPDAQKNFTALKAEALALFHEVEGSILYSPKLQKVLPLIVYNLSRYSDNPDFLREAVGGLLTVLDGGEQKEKLVQLLHAYIEAREGGQRPNVDAQEALERLLGQFSQQEREAGGAAAARGEVAELAERAAKEESRVMDVLTRIIAKQSANADIRMLSADKVDKIVHSLLSSPCNFTPLLHFIIPVQDGDMRAFAEMWIDPNSEEENSKGTGTQSDIHMLIVFDVDGIGRFESELFVHENDVRLGLFCPPAYVAAFTDIGKGVARAVADTPYRIREVTVDKLERQRSLMDVFKTLPHRRAGVDVTI